MASKSIVTGEQLGVRVEPSGKTGSREVFAGNMSALNRILKSTINDSSGYVVSEKEDGQTIFTDSVETEHINKALKYAKGKLNDYKKLNTQITEYVTLQTQLKIQGEKSRKALASIPKSSLVGTEKVGDNTNIEYRVPASTFASYQQEHADYLNAKKANTSWTGSKEARLTAETRVQKEVLGNVITTSNKENKEIEKQAKKALLDKYAKKYTANGADYASLVNKNLSSDKLKESFIEIEKRDAKERNEAKQKQQAEASRRKTLAAFTKVTGTITVLADLTRRILTHVMNIASQSRATAIQASTMGMSYVDMKKFNMADTFMGLKKGTHGNALGDIQSKFGDITNLDEKSIGILARVMGNKVSNLVTSGLGRDNPDKLLEEIMNSYFESYKSGKNSLGQYVGQEQALRELTTTLREVSPAFAEIFSTMAHDWKVGARAGSFGNYSEYLEQVQYNRGGLTETEMANVTALASVVNQAKQAFQGITDLLNTKVTNAFANLLSRIADTRLGESATEKVKHNMSNREKLQLSADTDRKTLEKNRLTFMANLDSFGEDYADLTLEDMQKYYNANMTLLEGDEKNKARKALSLISRASMSSDQTMISAIGQFISTKQRLTSSEEQLGRTSGDIEYLADTHTEEGKNMSTRDMILGLRNKQFSNGAGVFSSGIDLASQINEAVGKDKVVDINKLSPEIISLVAKAMERYYAEYGTDKETGAVDRLFNFDENGNAVLSGRRAEKNRKGNYKNAQLTEMAKAFNIISPENSIAMQSGAVTQAGLEKLLNLLSVAENAKNKYVKDGVLDEQAFAQDSQYSLYKNLKNAEVASFAGIYVNGGFGARADLIKSFEKALKEQQDDLQKQAELIAQGNSAVDSIDTNINNIQELLKTYMSKDLSGVYEVRKYEKGQTKVDVNIVVRDKEGRTIETRKETRYLSTGALESKITQSKVGDGKIMLSN